MKLKDMIQEIEMAIKFVRHIKQHLDEMKKEDGIRREVCCKICNETIWEIYHNE